jgi:hypothetical protein
MEAIFSRVMSSDMNPALQQALQNAHASATQASPGTPTLEDSLKNMQGLNAKLGKGIEAQGLEHGGDNLFEQIKESKMLDVVAKRPDAFKDLQSATYSVPASIQNNSIAEGANVGVVSKSQGR